MKTCYIISAVEMKNNFPSPDADDLVIAADAGYLNLQKTDIKPDVIIGDFDSAKKPEADAQVEAFPVLKDDTDTMLAIRYGFQSGYKRFEIYGGIGGERTDHTIANIQSLAYIAEHGGSGTLVGENERFTLIKNSSVTLHSEKGKTLSVFAYGGIAEGVSIKGAVYESDDLELSPFFPLGVSNKFKGDSATVGVKKGYILIKW
ncbi:MAG: thiamine diphosphokinase [Acutalibacteraceae bacterium]|nr:thiamine diphosphokinase [Acutalibacteraceae bacterium]